MKSSLEWVTRIILAIPELPESVAGVRKHLVTQTPELEVNHKHQSGCSLLHTTADRWYDHAHVHFDKWHGIEQNHAQVFMFAFMHNIQPRQVGTPIPKFHLGEELRKVMLKLWSHACWLLHTTQRMTWQQQIPQNPFDHQTHSHRHLYTVGQVVCPQPSV